MANFDRGLLLYLMNLTVLGVVCILYCLFTFCVFCARDTVRPYELTSFDRDNPESVRSLPLEDSDNTLSNVYVSASSSHLFPRPSFCDRHCQRHLDIAGRQLVPAFPANNNYQDSINHEINSNGVHIGSSRNERFSLDHSLVNVIRREEAPSDDPPPPYEWFQPPKYNCLY